MCEEALNAVVLILNNLLRFTKSVSLKAREFCYVVVVVAGNIAALKPVQNCACFISGNYLTRFNFMPLGIIAHICYFTCNLPRFRLLFFCPADAFSKLITTHQ